MSGIFSEAILGAATAPAWVRQAQPQKAPGSTAVSCWIADGHARDSLSGSADRMGPSAQLPPLCHASSARRRWEATTSSAGSGKTMA